MLCALTSMLISTEGGAACCIRLCGARGFSKDRSLMYCALMMSCWPCAVPGAVSGGWPLPVIGSDMFSVLLSAGCRRPQCAARLARIAPRLQCRPDRPGTPPRHLCPLPGARLARTVLNPHLAPEDI